MHQIYEVEVQPRWLQAIESGLKTVEGRKGSPTWSNVKVGDISNFVAPYNRPYSTMIYDIVHYPSVEDYLIHEGLNRTLPGVNSLQEGIDIYLKPTGFWSKADVEKYGILAFHLSPN